MSDQTHDEHSGADGSHGEHTHDGDDHDAHGADEGLDRVTSPMQAFGSREVGIGLVILAVGLIVTFVIPLVAA